MRWRAWLPAWQLLSLVLLSSKFHIVPCDIVMPREKDGGWQHTECKFHLQEREADLERVAAEALAASEAAEAQHSAEEQRLSTEREQLEARSAQVIGAPYALPSFIMPIFCLTVNPTKRLHAADACVGSFLSE